MTDDTVMEMVRDVLQLAEEALADRMSADPPSETMDAHSEGEIEACCALITKWIDLIEPSGLSHIFDRVDVIHRALTETCTNSLVGDVQQCWLKLRAACARHRMTGE